jgi:trk system potassium uptake protein TrkA
VDLDARSFERLGPGFGGRKLVGVGFDLEVLERAGIRQVDALAAVTGSDEANAVVGRLATRHFRVPRVVARLYDPGQADLYRRLGVLTISQVTWGVQRMIELLTQAWVGAVHSLGGGQVDLVEARVPELLVGRKVSELDLPGELEVVAVSRGGRTFLAAGPVLLESGDVVHVAVAAGAAGRLQQLLGIG